MSSKKRFTAILCIVVALAVFGVSAAAAVVSLSGYERVKAAAFKFVDDFSGGVISGSRIGSGMAIMGGGTSPNATYAFSATVSASGEVIARTEQRYQADGDKSLNSYSNFEAYRSETWESVTYADNDVVVSSSPGYYSERTQTRNDYYESRRRDSDEYQTGMTDTQRRFVEVLADTLVGDVKNYFVAEGDKVSVTLTGYQIPELAQLSLSMLAEANDTAYQKYGDINGYDDGMEVFQIGPDAKFTLASFEAVIDDEYNISAASARAEITSTVNGRPVSFEILLTFEVTDIGTTVVTKPEPQPGQEISGSYAKTLPQADAFEDFVELPEPELAEPNGIAAEPNPES
ncbi:MAG: hypothetical protein LBU58_06350 [Clostridiales bacterium]|nr:hypothetical protein [Clostridiales bacterium]